MAKYERLREPVFITSLELINSKHGGEVWEIHFMGIQSQKPYKTWADPNNVNWRTWEPIVDVAQRKGVVLTGCKFKDSEKGIINADSSVVPEYIVSREELADILEEYWKSRDKFNQLFGSE